MSVFEPASKIPGTSSPTPLKGRLMISSMTGASSKVEVITSIQRSRRSSAAEMVRMIEKTTRRVPR